MVPSSTNSHIEGIRSGIPLFDVEPMKLEILSRAREECKSSDAKLLSFVDAAAHVIRTGVSGEIVECGVWRGGAAMAIARVLLWLGDSERHLWLYDTFGGMTSPEAHDTRSLDGRLASELLTSSESVAVKSEASINVVESNLKSTGFDLERCRLVVGPVEETLQRHLPAEVAVLRVDTDFYSSTRACLEALLPRLSPGGIVLLDDHGWWDGARRAAEDVFAQIGISPFLHRVEESRVFVKTW